MIKLIIASLFSIFGTIIGFYFGNYEYIQTKISQNKLHDEIMGIKSEFINMDIFASPIFESENLKGYLIARFAVEIDLSKANLSGVDDVTLLADQFQLAIFDSKSNATVGAKIPDAALIASAMAAGANKVAGANHFSRILIQQVDVFDRSEVRKKVVDDRMVKD